jgi:hypothetical protein
MKKYHLLILLFGFLCVTVKGESKQKENTDSQNNSFPEREGTTIETKKEGASTSHQGETHIKKNNELNYDITQISREKEEQIEKLFIDKRKELTTHMNNAKKETDEYYFYLHHLELLNQSEREFKSETEYIDLKEIENYLEKNFSYDKYQRRGGWNFPNRAAEIMNDSIKEATRYVDLRAIKTQSYINRWMKKLLNEFAELIDNEGDLFISKLNKFFQQEKPEFEKIFDKKIDEGIHKFKISMNQEIQDLEKRIVALGKKSFSFLFYFGISGVCFFSTYQTIQKRLHTHFDETKKSKLKKIGLTIFSLLSFSATAFSLSKSYEIIKNFEK